MTQKSFYVDSCIWLNLFKKEGDSTKGIPYWKIAKDFVDKIIFSKSEEIIYTTFILREIKFNIGDENKYKERLRFFKGEEKFQFINAIEEDYSFARKLESEFRYELSFYDCLHIAVCKRLNSILVTRDDYLIRFARKYIVVDKPENLIS